MTETQFVSSIEALGIKINSQQLQQLSQYYELLIDWNEKINLTSIIEKDLVYLKHFYDSLTITKVIDLNTISSLCDIGTGAGFPGVVLKIIYPHLEVTLVDSTNKRMLFLVEVIKALNLEKVTLITSRAEDYALKVREKYDVVTARAVANLSILLEYCVPLVKINGYFIPLKGNVAEELSKTNLTIEKLFLTIEQVEMFKLPVEASERTIIKFKKMAATPLKYPRPYKEMLNRPL